MPFSETSFFLVKVIGQRILVRQGGCFTRNVIKIQLHFHNSTKSASIVGTFYKIEMRDRVQLIIYKNEWPSTSSRNIIFVVLSYWSMNSGRPR